MTLAETASTFAEAVVMDSMLASDDVSMAQKRAVLEAKLSDAAVFMLNTPMRYRFERSVYERRAEGELSVTDFKNLMEAAQRGSALQHFSYFYVNVLIRARCARSPPGLK